MKEFEVKVQRGKHVVVLPIRAPNKQAAEEHAALLLQRRGGKAQVIGATEKKQ